MNLPGSTQYLVRHLTRFAYSVPISESVMEVRMQPRSDGPQRCLRFDLTTTPRARVFAYQDPAGNVVHHFDVPNRHSRLNLTAEAVVEMTPAPSLPDSLPLETWHELAALDASGRLWDYLSFSPFACDTPLLRQLARDLGVGRQDDPLSLLRRLTSAMFDTFAYVPQSTRVDSPIDDALRARAGVCQDFAHIMIGLVRMVGIPCRYVSGYLSPGLEGRDRSADGATHAWVEACVPGLGWLGLDPTNNLVAAERHVRVAVGRDYGDVPPTRGVFRGEASSELLVSVSVSRPETPVTTEKFMPTAIWVSRDAGTQSSPFGSDQ